MEEESQEDVSSAGDVTSHSLVNLPINLGANLYCADRTILLPEMGASGAAMLAWTLAKNLGNSQTVTKG